MCNFESKVLLGLQKCSVDLKKNSQISIGAAVSGGADSIALLISLSNLLNEYKLPLYVITVNHNIRSAEEAGGDALYVKTMCEELKKQGRKIEFKCVELEPGLVDKVALQRQQGIEDAARFLRYEVFENFINEYSLSYLCLAHNKNDQLETLLMRFLQGTGCESGGIAAVRGKYIRPILDIERTEIESYLTEKKIAWRTDSTNFDTDYLRNKIRHKLVPFLNMEFNGWQKAVLSGGRKAEQQNEMVNSCVEDFSICKTEDEISIDYDSFTALPDAVKAGVLKKAMNLAGEQQRIPFAFIEDVLKSLTVPEKPFYKIFNKLKIEFKKNSLFIKKLEKSQTDLVFFDIIEESGKFLFPFGEMDVFILDSNNTARIVVNNRAVVEKITLPFIVRNIQIDDEVKCSDGSKKKLSDIISNWHVEEQHKKLIPVLQLLEEAGQPIIAIAGSIFGYKDWIVK